MVSVEKSFSVSPWQIVAPGGPGELLQAVGSGGVESTMIAMVAKAEVQVSGGTV